MGWYPGDRGPNVGIMGKATFGLGNAWWKIHHGKSKISSYMITRKIVENYKDI
jgi:hypothetical protein